MKLTQLGTANAAGIPVYGCDCAICCKAKLQPWQARQKTSAVIEHLGKRLLIDMNHDQLSKLYPPKDIDLVLLTHYHMDHVIAMFDMRWGIGHIPVRGPNDQQGCDDLFKHPGIFDIQPALDAFQPFIWQDLTITPLPLQHSKPTFGYAFEWQSQTVAYLTDTYGLPDVTKQWLSSQSVQLILIDATHPPGASKGGHNDIAMAKQLFAELGAKAMGLIHLDHLALSWAEGHPEFFNNQFFIVDDMQEFIL